MKNLNYYLMKMPLAKGRFMAKTVMNNTYSDKELIQAMVRNNPELKENDIKSMLKALVSTTEELLIQGIGISIPGFFRISPSIKGSFDSDKDYFDPARHEIAINCSLQKSYLSDLRKNIKVEKTEGRSNWPTIVTVRDNTANDNIIRKENANFMTGKNLIVPGYELDGINVTLISDIAKTFLIPLKDIEVIMKKPKELLYIFRKSITIPEWLTDNADISVKLRYKPEQGDFIESGAFKTTWMN